jgi:hypothetical protein
MTSAALRRQVRDLLEDTNANAKELRIPEFWPAVPKAGIRKPVLVPRTSTQFHPQEMKERMETVNLGSALKPYDPRLAYPNWGVPYDPHIQKVCPTCRLVLRRAQMKSTFYNRSFRGDCECPACGTLLEI